MRSEIGAVYGPLVVAAIAIAAGAGATAGEEEDGVLGLILAYPVDRSRFVVAKALAVAVGVLLVSLGTFAGMVAGVAIGGGGVGVGEIVALAVHLAGFGFAVGALALALGAASGRRSVAVGGAAAVTLLGFLVNGFAPFLAGAHWLRYGSFFHFYAGHDPLANGIDPGDLAVLAAAATVLTGIAVAAFSRRDLRA
jgi:ABC-2 type transport system permease protein